MVVAVPGVEEAVDAPVDAVPAVPLPDEPVLVAEPEPEPDAGLVDVVGGGGGGGAAVTFGVASGVDNET